MIERNGDTNLGSQIPLLVIDLQRLCESRQPSGTWLEKRSVPKLNNHTTPFNIKIGPNSRQVLREVMTEQIELTHSESSREKVHVNENKNECLFPGG